MTNSLIKIDTQVTTVELLNEHIAKTLGRYSDTKHLKLEYGLPKEDANGFAVPMTLSQVVKRDQDARGMAAEGKEAKAARKLEFDAVKAIFVNEGINDMIEALFRYLGYQPRFTGISKSGVATMQFLAPWKAAKDAVGKKAKSLEVETKMVALERRAEAYKAALPAETVREIEAEFTAVE